MTKIKNLKEKILVTILYLCVILLMYYLNISCIFIQLFNAPCPGCGMTRALLSALRFDFVKAFDFHPMFWSVPILYLYFLFDCNLFKSKKMNIVLFACISIGFAFNWCWQIFQLFVR